MNQAAQDMRSLLASTIRAGVALSAATLEQRARLLADAASRLARADSALSQELRTGLEKSTRLSRAMIEWGLSTSLSAFDVEALLELAKAPTPPRSGAMRARPGQLAVVVLSGNVFTACLRAVAVPLLFGWPVVAKASSRDDALPRALEAALGEADPTLGRAYRVVTFQGDDDARASELFAQADAVSVFGSDSTVNRVRARLAATVSFIAHGHGLGVALLPRDALSSEQQADTLASRLALDIAAYDQRGCLSPHTIWIEKGGHISPDSFANHLHRALSEVERRLPRGPLPLEAESAQLQWRGVSSVHGTLLEGKAHAISLETDSPLRVSPGHRNVQLVQMQDINTARDRLFALGVHLKCLGVPDRDYAQKVAGALPARVAPRICSIGTMQTPALDSLSDGIAPWEGLLRWVEVD